MFLAPDVPSSFNKTCRFWNRNIAAVLWRAILHPYILFVCRVKIFRHVFSHAISSWTSDAISCTWCSRIYQKAKYFKKLFLFWPPPVICVGDVNTVNNQKAWCVKNFTSFFWPPSVTAKKFHTRKFCKKFEAGLFSGCARKTVRALTESYYLRRM